MKLRKSTITSFLFVSFIAIKPLYLRGSGGLQISDLCLLMLFAVLAFSNRARVKNKASIRWIRLFFYVIIYQLIVNIIWTFVSRYQGYTPINRGDNMIFQTLYYVFNFMVAICVILMAEQYGTEEITKLFIKGIMIASMISFLGLFIGSSGKRNTGFFNNPNQLGYFSLITLSVGAMLKGRMKRYEYIVIILTSLTSIILSLSKGAIIPAALLLILQYLNIGNKEMTTKRLMTSLIMIAVVSYVIYLFFYSSNPYILNNNIIRAARFRIINMGNESDSNLYYGRGYGRIAEIGFLSLIGVGEGIYRRFKIMTGIEAHSLYASLIVSYGLFGIVSYIRLFLRPFLGKNKRWYELSLFVPVLLYNVSHNGIRNTLLWALISILLVQTYSDKQRKLPDIRSRQE